MKAIQAWLSSVTTQPVVETARNNYGFRLTESDGLVNLLEKLRSWDEEQGHVLPVGEMLSLVQLLPALEPKEQPHALWAIPGEEWAENPDAPWQERLLAKMFYHGQIDPELPASLAVELCKAGFTGVVEQFVRSGEGMSLRKARSHHYRNGALNAVEAVTEMGAMRLLKLMLDPPLSVSPQDALKFAQSGDAVTLLSSAGAKGEHLPQEWTRRLGAQRAKALVSALDAASGTKPEDVLHRALREGSATLISAAAKEAPDGMKTRFGENGWSIPPSILLAARSGYGNGNNKNAMLKRALKTLPVDSAPVYPGLSERVMLTLVYAGAEAGYGEREEWPFTLAPLDQVLKELPIAAAAPSSPRKSQWLAGFWKLCFDKWKSIYSLGQAHMPEKYHELMQAMSSIAPIMVQEVRDREVPHLATKSLFLRQALSQGYIDAEQMLRICCVQLLALAEESPARSVSDWQWEGAGINEASDALGKLDASKLSSDTIAMLLDKRWDRVEGKNNFGPRLRTFIQLHALENAVSLPGESSGSRMRM